MPDAYTYLVFFYWLSGATTTLAIILFFEILKLRRQVNRIEHKIDTSTVEISVIKKRLEGLHLDTNIDSGDVKEISKKMMSEYDFKKTKPSKKK
jgi:hypothetical protein